MDTGAVLNRLETKMKLKKRLLSRLMLIKPRKVSHSTDFTESKRAYYMNEEYLKEYGKEDMQKLNKLLDPWVISFLGYESRGSVN